MKYVLIENLSLCDYEQAGIALNGGQDIVIRNVELCKSSKNVIVKATYSQSRFIRSFLSQIINSGNPSIIIKGVSKSGSDILQELENEMNSVYKDFIIDKKLPTSTLYLNNSQVIDGSIYGIVLNVLGVAVNNF